MKQIEFNKSAAFQENCFLLIKFRHFHTLDKIFGHDIFGLNS